MFLSPRLSLTFIGLLTAARCVICASDTVTDSTYTARDAQEVFEMMDIVGAVNAVRDCENDEISLLSLVSAVNTSDRERGTLDYISYALANAGFYQAGTFESAGQSPFAGDIKTVPLLPTPHFPLPTSHSQLRFHVFGMGRLTSGYGYRPQFGRMHYGIDIAMAVGDTVRCAGSGIVTRVDYEPGGYGRYVVIAHDDGLETRYAHLHNSLVEEGDRVTTRDAIALSGNSGNSTGPHLHFETRFAGLPVDPLTVFTSLHSTDWKYASHTGDTGAIDAHAASRTTYVVKSGDTLKGIAAKCGIRLSRLCQLNMLTQDSPLEPGRMLKIH